MRLEEVIQISHMVNLKKAIHHYRFNQLLKSITLIVSIGVLLVKKDYALILVGIYLLLEIYGFRFRPFNEMLTILDDSINQKVGLNSAYPGIERRH